LIAENPTPPADAARAWEIAQFVYSTVIRLDARDFVGWLAQCDAGFTYAIRAWSPEIRRDVTFIEHDRDGIEMLVRQLPRHNSDQSVLTRHATVYTVGPETGESVEVVSALTVYRTELDGGATAIFAVGRYHDRVRRTPDGLRLASREVRLDTRSLGIGTHYPL
jgi:methanesulfonate monooxygenase subunit beta